MRGLLLRAESENLSFRNIFSESHIWTLGYAFKVWEAPSSTKAFGAFKVLIYNWIVQNLDITEILRLRWAHLRSLRICIGES